MTATAVVGSAAEDTTLKLLRTVPGEPFRYALNRNAYVRRELEDDVDDAAPAEDSKQ